MPPLRGTPPDPLPLPPSRPNAALRRCWRAQGPSTSDASRTSTRLRHRVKPVFDRAEVFLKATRSGPSAGALGPAKGPRAFPAAA